MIPKEIALQLVQLKEKIKTYSSIQRTLDVSERRDKVDEIKATVENANAAIADLAKKTDNILVDVLPSNFEIDRWFEELKDNAVFSEPNPKLIYEEEQRERERKRKIAEEKEKQEIERQRKFAEEAKREREHQRRILEEKAKQKLEEEQKRLKTGRIEEYRKLCYSGPDDIEKVRELIQDGLDIIQDGRVYDLSTLITRGRSSKFIKSLIEVGMEVNKDEQQELERLVNFEKKREEKEIEDHQKKLQSQRIDEFRKIWYNGPDDIDKLQKLISEGLDINQPMVLPTLTNLIIRGRSLKFIQYLVAAGMKITGNDIAYCLKNKSGFNSEAFLYLLISAKNIDQEAIEMAKAALKQKADEQRIISKKLERQLKQKEEEQKLLLEQQNRLNQLKEVNGGKYVSFSDLLINGDLEEIRNIFNLGLIDVNQKVNMNSSIVAFPILPIFETRGLDFIQLLIDSGYIVTKKDIDFYNSNTSIYEHLNIPRFPKFKQILNVLITSKNIEKDAIQKINEIKQEEQKKVVSYIKQSQIAEFRFLCYNGPDDVIKVQQLIDDGLDITQRNSFYSISVIIDRKRSIDFIRFLIDAGMFVSKNDVEFCIKNSLNPLSKELLNILITAKNIDNNALVLVEEIKNKKRISSASIASEEPSNSIVEEKVKPKITNTIHLHGNQLPRHKQSGYEGPNGQGKKDIAGSVKEFNHKEIKRKKLILWIVVTLISISIIALIYIYFEEIMGFFKILLIILLLPLLLPIILKKR